MEDQRKRHVLLMVYVWVSRRQRLLIIRNGERLLSSNSCIHFKEKLTNYEVHGKSPFVRGNILRNQ